MVAPFAGTFLVSNGLMVLKRCGSPPDCACATGNRVAGGHIVAGLGCEGPSIGYRHLACPCGPRSGGGYVVKLGEETRAGGSRSINHRDVPRAGDVGEDGGLESDCERNGYCPSKCR